MRLAEDVLLWRAEGLRRLNGHDPRYGRVVPVADLDRAFGGPSSAGFSDIGFSVSATPVVPH